jgi:trk system potassium uptake protein TrkA
MKYIIIGLGNFGTSLAVKLTDQGHEVIGVDKDIDRVEYLKERITYAICLNSKDPEAVKSLPVKNTDIVIVCIGEDESSNLIASALMKKMNAKRLICRALSPMHKTILETMGIDEIISPEEESADRLVIKISTGGYVDSLEMSKGFGIIEALVPKKYSGKTLKELDFLNNYNVIVMNTIRYSEESNILGVSEKTKKNEGIANAGTILTKGDIMVLYGNYSDIEQLLKD